MNQIDELEIVRALYVTDEPSDAARDAAAARLQARIDGAVARRRHRRPLVLGGVGLAGSAAVLFAIAVGGEDSALNPAPADARAVLVRVASVAEKRADRPLAPGEYWYVDAQQRYMLTVGDGPGYSAITRSTRATWTGRSGDGRYVERTLGTPVFFGPRDRKRWEEQGRPLLTGSRPDQVSTASFGDHGVTIGSRTISYEQLDDLPTDGRAMYRELLAAAGDAGPSPDEEVFATIGDLLRSEPVPPDIRAGLFRAAAYIKGIRLVGAVRDALGRRGVAIELHSRDMLRRLVFDPQTALLLAEQDVLAERVGYLDAAAGTVIGERLAVSQGIVADDQTRLR